MVALSRNLSSKHAMEMLLTGDVVDAAYAYRVGLVNAVIAPDDLSAHVDQVAAAIAAKSQAAIRIGKRAFSEQRHLPVENAYAHAAAVMSRNMLDGAACEGLDAFISKRSPKWPELT